MCDRGVHAVDHLHGDDGVEIFGRPVLFLDGLTRGSVMRVT